MGRSKAVDDQAEFGRNGQSRLSATTGRTAKTPKAAIQWRHKPGEGADPEHDPAADPLLRSARAFEFDQCLSW